jgi:hypothetical protein
VVKDQIIVQRNSEYFIFFFFFFGVVWLEACMAKGLTLVKDQEFRKILKILECGQRPDQNLALIPNETNKVRSHKNNPKYLEYNKVIHIGL